ncbi:DDE_3 domain-containing protein [Trichonephila inaurata madagascariensis]|uniref:DDE_3 domain-containing protein n=1 Tax=Trichonephila inaurata madagascariensis TaxID=2747483 RepID=A0A8X7BQB6_9ARAC|nr:DDE_3 domain-containing protein [Trichonephila inaurata madagascariensis]
MVATFFSYLGHIATIVLEDSKTVTVEWCVTKCLPEVLQQWHLKRLKCGTRGMILHHNNVLAHSAQRMKDYLLAKDIKTLPHPPYLPDLVLCDFFLLSQIKNKMQGSRFGSAEAITEYRNQLDQLSKDEWL